MLPIRPLFITPYYKYSGDVNSSLNSLFIDSLKDRGFMPVVLASENSGHSANLVLRAKFCFLSRVILKIARVLSLPIKFEYLPDLLYWIWANNAIKVGKRYIDNSKIDYLHSISVPYSSHLVALSLKKKYGIPWIAHFYEPWSDNTYRKSTPYVKVKNEVWEKEVAINADIIIHNSEIMCNKWRLRYGDMVEGKLFYLPMPLSNSSKKKSSNKGSGLVISHIGNFYGIRNSSIFLESLNVCLNKNPSLREKISVNFIGLVTDWDKELVNKYKLGDIVTFVGQLSEEECVKYYINSDVFLVIEGKDQGPLFFPSKLIKYLYYEKPIIGITESGSVLDNLLKENRHYSYTHDNIKGIADYIYIAVNSYNSLLSFKRDAWKEYEISNVIEGYKRIVEELLYNKHKCGL